MPARPDAIPAVHGGGGRQASISYVNVGSIGGAGGLVSSAAYQVRAGFAGQLNEVQSLRITAASTNLDEGTTHQLTAQGVMQDATLLSLGASSVVWSVANGPIDSVTTDGQAVVGAVYRNTSASVQGAFQSRTGLLHVTVVDVNTDNFGLYSGDGLDDSWQVFYFGFNNTNAAPGADPDGDGFTNSQELQAGTNPTLPPNPVADKALNVAIAGSGTVVRAPNQTNFTNGASATLTANPTAGWFFAGWTNDITLATNVLSLVITQNVSVTAVFDSLTSALANPGSQQVAEGNQLLFGAASTNATAATLRYALVSGPVGTTVNTNSGVVSWTPTEADGPSTNSILVSVNDLLNPATHYTNAYTVIVTEVNLPPVLAAGSNRSINVGQLLSITNSATDADLPANAITFTLPVAPAGAVIGAADGVLTWTPAGGQTGTNLFSVVATDSGVPPLSSTQSFHVVVAAVSITPPMLSIAVPGNGNVVLTITGTTGVEYRIEAKTNLTETNWTQLGTTNPTASPFSFTDTNGASLLRRYYRAVNP